MRAGRKALKLVNTTAPIFTLTIEAWRKSCGGCQCDIRSTDITGHFAVHTTDSIAEVMKFWKSKLYYLHQKRSLLFLLTCCRINWIFSRTVVYLQLQFPLTGPKTYLKLKKWCISSSLFSGYIVCIYSPSGVCTSMHTFAGTSVK